MLSNEAKQAGEYDRLDNTNTVKLFGLSSNIRIYKYEGNQCFGPHVDESIHKPDRTFTVYTVLIYLSGHPTSSAFTVNGYCSKNLRFVLAEQEYQKLVAEGKEDGAKEKAHTIWKQFVEIGSEYEVTIRPEDRAAVQQPLSKGSYQQDLFKPVLKIAGKNLRADEGRRFLVKMRQGEGRIE